MFNLLLECNLLINLLFVLPLAMPCAPQEFTDGIVCVCNDTYCDTLEDVEPTGENDFVAVSSSKVSPISY